jgi:DNA mismatch endonuclease (patch repair protein)
MAASRRVIRRALHRMGFRYRLHAANLPGRPDLVFPSRRSVIFIHGCFWHRHAGCSKTTSPKTRAAFWRKKFEANKLRDRKAAKELTKRGWRVLIVWECQTRSIEKTVPRIVRFLEGA